MDSVNTTAETADQLLVSNNIIKLELSDRGKSVNSPDNEVPPFSGSETAFQSTPHEPSQFSNLGPAVTNPPNNSVANYGLGDFLENEAVKSPEERKPTLTEGGFINDLVPRKVEVKLSESRRGSLTGETPASPETSSLRLGCSLNDLPSGSTEADFGIVKEELHIEDIEEGAQYPCLSSHSSVTESLYASPLPDSIEPFIKGTEAESLLKTDVRMNENASQENIPQMLDLLNKPVKPIRRQRVKKTPKLGARLSSVISKLAQSKETLILTPSNPGSSAASSPQASFPPRTVDEACGGPTQPELAPADTASNLNTVQSNSNAQELSNSTNQCLDTRISSDEFTVPSNLISAASELDKTKSSLVVDRLKRLGTSIEVEKPTVDALERSSDGRSADILSKSEPSITIEPQPFVTTRSLSQSPPSLRVFPTKSRTAKKSAKVAEPEASSTKGKTLEAGVSSEKAKPAVEIIPSIELNPISLEPSDEINLLQYKKCFSVLDSIVKADDIVKDITKNCIKNKTNRKINKSVLKYDSTLSKQNWKSNLVTDDSSPSKTTLILNKKNPLKTKIKIVSSPANDSKPESNPAPQETEIIVTSQKIDGESVKVIMDKHNFTIGENSIIEMPTGQKMYTCDVCSGVYQKGFSLKRHILRSHINHYFFRVKEAETSGELTFQLSGGADDNGGLDPAKALLFRCHVCGSCFSLRSELKGHLTAHPPVNSISNNDVKVYKCINCSEVFNKKKEFSKHRKTCVIEVPVAAPSAPAPKQRLNLKLPCLFCPKVFPSAIDRRKHGFKMHHPKKKVHPCFKCVETFQTQASVFNHLRESHKNDYLICVACKERFSNSAELKAHCLKKHKGNVDAMTVLGDKNGVIDSFEEKEEKPEKTAELVCNKCSKTFSNQSNLNKHVKTFHLLDKDGKVSVSPKHVVILSKSSLSGKEPKASKSKIDLKKLNVKSKTDVKSKDPDSAFYEELSDNIQFNLMHHIDGKLQSEKKNTSPSSMTEASTTSPGSKSDSPGKTQSLAQLDLVGKSAVNKGASTSAVQDEKPTDWYGNTLNYTADMSHLDIATQLTMKRNLHILNSSRAKAEDTSQVCGSIRLKRVKDLSKDLALERPETLCAESFGDSTFGALESNAGLSGFWVRPHNYVCFTCGSQSLNFWDMEDHKWNFHPNVKCSHYEFTENHLPGLEFFTSRAFGSEDALEPDGNPEVPSATNRSRCSKCKKTCNSTLELHRHMLECGMDTTWMLTLMPSPSKKQKEKKKWRPFGSRRRRMSRVRGFKRNIPNSPMKIIFPPKFPLGKSKSGDTETIQKMIANLPAKRATRRVVIFDNPSKAGQATINCVPITSLNWNNNTYEDGLIQNLLKNDQQGVPSGSSAFSTSSDSLTVSPAGCLETLPTSADLLSNSASRTRIVPIWPPAEQSDVLTSLRMMPIPQTPMKVETRPPLTKVSEPEIKPVQEAAKPTKQLKPIKPVKQLRSVVRQLSASSLESPSETTKKSPVQSDKSSSSGSRSASPGGSETSPKINGLSLDKPTKTSSPTSPSKITLALAKYSVKKPSDLAKEKSTILNAMRIAMADSDFSEGTLTLKSTRGTNVLKKSLSESLLTSKTVLRSGPVCDNDQNSCIDCNKVFKNEALLKKHLSRCPVLKRIRSLNSTPNLIPGVSPTPGEIEALISSPVIVSKDQSPAMTKGSSKRDVEIPPNDGTTKPINTKTRKATAKDNAVTFEAKVSEAPKTRTLKKLSELSKSTKTVADNKTTSNSETSAKFSESTEGLILNEATGEFAEVDPPRKLRKKVSIMTRSAKSNYVTEKSTKLKPSSASETLSEQVPSPSVEATTKGVENSNTAKTTVVTATSSVPNRMADLSSDSDTDSTPLVQLKEILTANKTEKPKKKVLIKKKKVFRKRRTKLGANFIKVRIGRNTVPVEEPATSVQDSFVEKKVDSSQATEQVSDKKVSNETVRTRSGKFVSTKAKKRVVPQSKGRILRNRGGVSGPQNSVTSETNTKKAPSSLKSNAEPKEVQTDEIKEDNLDESFKLCLSEEEEKKQPELFPVSAGEDTKDEAKIEPGNSMHDEGGKNDVLSDAKSTSSLDEAPSKPKRKRRSAYNLLFTSLKQEDMNELLTTIQADRQNLKRKCTLVEPPSAVDKKPKKVPGKEGESTDKSSDVEAPSQSENAPTGENSTEADSEMKPRPGKKDKFLNPPILKRLRRDVDKVRPNYAEVGAEAENSASKEVSEEGETEVTETRLGVRGKPLALKGRNLKKNLRGRFSKTLETVENSVTSTEEESVPLTRNTTRKAMEHQALLDDWLESDIQSSGEASTDTAVESSSTPTVKTRQRLNSPVTKSPVTTAQVSTNRQNKNQRGPESAKINGDDQKASPKSTLKLRSSAEARSVKSDGTDDLILKSSTDDTILKTEASSVLVGSRTRAKKSNSGMDVPPSSDWTDYELDPVTGELVPKSTESVGSVEPVLESETSQSKSKNASINAKTSVNSSKNVEPGTKDVSDTSLNSKKRKRPKKGVAKDVLSEVTSDDDNLPLSSLSEENVASSLSINSEAELSDTNQKKQCLETSVNSNAADSETIVESDSKHENSGEDVSSLLRVKNKSKNLKRKRRKEFRQSSLLNNIDSPMTSDSEASILRVRKKQPKTKKSSLANQVNSALEGNDLLANNPVFRKQLAKLKNTKDLKKVLDRINKGKTSDPESSDPSILGNSPSNDSLASSVIQRKKKLKKKKLKKKKLKNFKDKDLVNVLVQTVAKTANKLLTKKSAEQLRKKQLKLQRKKALEKLSHANNAWQISIVNPESKETPTTEIPDSSNDLEEKKEESIKLPVSEDLDSDSSNVTTLPKNRSRLYCSSCDESFPNSLSYTKHFYEWDHLSRMKPTVQSPEKDHVKGSVNCETTSVSSNTSISTSVSNISLSSLKSKLSAAAKSDETSSTEPVMPVASNSLQELQAPAAQAHSSSGMEPIYDSNWAEPSWQMNSGPEPSNDWDNHWRTTIGTHEPINLGLILDSVNEILADPISADPHSDSIGQYSLADLQNAICATDEGMALLQHWNESEYVYDNSAVQQASQPASFNEWTFESNDLIDLDNQNAQAKKPAPIAAESSDNSKSSQSGKVAKKPKKAESPKIDYETVELTCPTASCSKRFHGITALRTHIGWAHSKNKRATAYCNPKTDLLTTCMTNEHVPKALVCFVCKEICSTSSILDSHVNTSHIRKKSTDLAAGSSKLPLSEGAAKLKSKMSSAFGGLLDRALNNLKLNPQKAPASGESSKSPILSADTLKLLGQLKEKRRLENAESKTLTSNLALELRQLLSRKNNDDSPNNSDIPFSRRSSIDSDAEVSSTVKNDFLRPFGCPLCSMTFASSIMRNRHITTQHGTRRQRQSSEVPVPAPTSTATPAPTPTPASKPEEPPVTPSTTEAARPSPEKKEPAPKFAKPKAPREKPQVPNDDIDWDMYDFECDNCHTTVSYHDQTSSDDQESGKPKKPTKRATGKKALTKKDTASPSESSTTSAAVSKPQMSKNYIKKYVGRSKVPVTKDPQTIKEEEEAKKARLEEERKRQNDAFDMLLGKEPTEETPKGKAKLGAKGKRVAKPESKTPAVSKKAPGKTAKELKMPALKPVKAPTKSRVSPDIPAPVLKPISEEVLKLTDRKSKPPPLEPAVPPKNKTPKSIDTLSCDSDSCKLEGMSFDLPEIEPYSSGMVESPNSGEEETGAGSKPNPPKKPVAIQSKCDNISELEQLFSDDDSDQETKVEKSPEKGEGEISPESLKSISVFRDTMKTLKSQSSTVPKSSDKAPSAADVYDFED